MFLNRLSALAMKLFIAPAWPSWATTKQQRFMLSFANCFHSFAVSKKGFSLIRRRREESSTALWKAFLCIRLLDVRLQSAAFVRENLFSGDLYAMEILTFAATAVRCPRRRSGSRMGRHTRTACL